jgi:hypothetical protein
MNDNWMFYNTFLSTIYLSLNFLIKLKEDICILLDLKLQNEFY